MIILSVLLANSPAGCPFPSTKQRESAAPRREAREGVAQPPWPASRWRAAPRSRAPAGLHHPRQSPTCLKELWRSQQQGDAEEQRARHEHRRLPPATQPRGRQVPAGAAVASWASAGNRHPRHHRCTGQQEEPRAGVRKPG